MKIVHYFLHKLFLVFCIKLFSVQHYLKNCSLSFLLKLFSVHCLKNCSLFSHKTLSEIMFSKFKSQSGISLYRFETMFFCYKFMKMVVFGHFCLQTLVFLFNFAAQIVVFFYYKINNLLLKWNWSRNLW